MPKIQKSVLVSYSDQQMFDLVENVEKYPEFLPWCSGTQVLSRDSRITRATIKINYHHVKQSFTTENVKNSPNNIVIKLIQGPFKHLDGHWRFSPIGEHGCKIELDLHYDFSNKILEKLFGPLFHHVANTFVDAFVKRAEGIYR